MQTKLKFEDIKVGDELVFCDEEVHIVKIKTESFLITINEDVEYLFNNELKYIPSEPYHENSILTDYYKPKSKCYGIIKAERTEQYNHGFGVENGELAGKLFKKFDIWQELCMQEGAREFDLHKKNHYVHCNFDNVIGVGIDNDHRYLQIYFDTDNQVRQAISNIGEEKLKILFGV